MRHRVRGRKLNRTASHRLATFRALATALFREKKIRTTISKAKELRTFAEPLISRAKEDTVANRRLISRHIQDKNVLKELFSEIIPKVGDRPGGYTRIVKLGQRRGDAAEMAIIELVDYNDVNSKEKAPKTKVKNEVIQEANVIEESVDENTIKVETKTEETSSEEINSEKISSDDTKEDK